MSVLRSRAEIDREVRTAQFEIRRPCPTTAQYWEPELIAALPLAVTVVARLADKRCECGHPSYDIVRGAPVMSLAGPTSMGITTFEPGAYPAVCTEMGSIIE